MSIALKDQFLNRRHDIFKADVNEAKENLIEALSNLELSKEANENLERSVLDFAIHIALIILELSIIDRIKEGNLKLITKRAVDDIAVGNWEDILRIPMRIGG